MAIKLKTGSVVTVVTKGTAVQVSLALIRTPSAVIQADIGNSGNIYYGDDSVDKDNGQALGPGESGPMTPPERPSGTDEILLDEVWVDADNNGAKARILYFIRTRR